MESVGEGTAAGGIVGFLMSYALLALQNRVLRRSGAVDRGDPSSSEPPDGPASSAVNAATGADPDPRPDGTTVAPEVSEQLEEVIDSDRDFTTEEIIAANEAAESARPEVFDQDEDVGTAAAAGQRILIP